MERLTVTVGDKVFTASLSDNKAVHVLKGKLPRTIEMKDLHANEKCYGFEDSFPTNHRSVGSIDTGDIMLFGSDTIVIFYKSFRTP